MKNLLNQFITYYNKSDKFQERLLAYDYIMKQKEWQFHKDTLITIKGMMMADLFSHRFTELPQAEKDIIQRTYYNINEMLDFLLNPNSWIKQKSKFFINPIELMGKVNAKAKNIISKLKAKEKK